MRPRDPEQMAEAARLYYLHRHSVDEVARALQVSPATVSRLLRDARDQGIVEIRVRDPRTASEAPPDGETAPD